jgi:nucleoside-diphosphate-sugar epimerase
MRVFIAGATGVIGTRLVPLLVGAGHQVVGMTRSQDKVSLLRDLGAEAVVCDVFAARALREAVIRAAPELVMHQLTDLPDEVDQIPVFAERNNRIRTEGTQNLISAAQAAGASRFIAQSIAWTPPAGGEAVEQHERMVLDAGGLVLRYGTFYGPGTYGGDRVPDPPRVHVDEAARRTVELLDAAGPSIVVITDAEDPSP